MIRDTTKITSTRRLTMYRCTIRHSISLCFALLTLSACGAKENFNVEKEITRFYTHQSAFEALAKTGCEAKEALNTGFFRYPRDVVGEEPEHIQQYFTDIQRLLDSIGLKNIVLRSYREEDIECSIFVIISVFSFIADGYDFGYWYRPAEHGTYEYTEGFFSQEATEYRNANRIRGEEPVRFSIELKSEWYLHYHNYP